MAKRYAERRSLAIEVLGGQCVACGTEDDLQFDHVDPSIKAFTVSENLHRRWGDVVVELTKCQLLCKPCHDLKTLTFDVGRDARGRFYAKAI
jgi:5-methylcytosine-specific restriction endonuclease McrA